MLNAIERASNEKIILAIQDKLRSSLFLPVIFVLATTIGMGFHLLSIDLPIPEIVISSSVILFGVLLAIRKQKTRISWIYTAIVSALAAISGIFHGQAYGESIFGAEPTPLIAYLIDFTFIQLAIAISAYLLAQKISFKYLMGLAGGAIAAIGIVFLSSAITG
jgi:urease accessory protein